MESSIARFTLHQLKCITQTGYAICSKLLGNADVTVVMRRADGHLQEACNNDFGTSNVYKEHKSNMKVPC